MSTSGTNINFLKGPPQHFIQINNPLENGLYILNKDNYNTVNGDFINTPKTISGTQLGLITNDIVINNKTISKSQYNEQKFTEFLTQEKYQIYTLILDNDYEIGTTGASPTHDINIIGNNHKIFLTVNDQIANESNQDPQTIKCGLIKANEYNIYINSVKFLLVDNFNNNINKATVINLFNGYTSTLGNITFYKCSFLTNSQGKNPSAAWGNFSNSIANSSENKPIFYFNLDTYKYGFSLLKLDTCLIEQNTNNIITTYNMPGSIQVTNCIVKNLKNRIVVAAVNSPSSDSFISHMKTLKTEGNDANYIHAYNQLLRQKISLIITNNHVFSDKIIDDMNIQYVCFIWGKVGNVVATNNIIENIAVNLTNNGKFPTEVFPMYLLSENVNFSNNICKNIYNFGYNPVKNLNPTWGAINKDQKPNATEKQKNKLATVKQRYSYHTHSFLPNIKMYTGNKNISNNTFILEESFLQQGIDKINQKSGENLLNITDLFPPVLIESYALNDNMTIENNNFDVYFMHMSRMSEVRCDNSFNISNNTFKIKHLGKNNYPNDYYGASPEDSGITIATSDETIEINDRESEDSLQAQQDEINDISTNVKKLGGASYNVSQICKTNNLFYTYGGTYLITNNTFIIENLQQEFNLVRGSEPKSENTTNILSIIKNNLIKIKDYKSDFYFVRNLTNSKTSNNKNLSMEGKAIIVDNIIEIEDYKKAFCYSLGPSIELTLNNNSLIIKNSNTQSGTYGLIHENAKSTANIFGKHNLIFKDQIVQNIGNIALGARKINYSFNGLKNNSINTNNSNDPFKLFFFDPTLDFPQDKQYIYNINLKSKYQNYNQTVKIAVVPQKTTAQGELKANSYNVYYYSLNSNGELTLNKKTAKELWEDPNPAIRLYCGEQSLLQIKGNGENKASYITTVPTVHTFEDNFSISISTIISNKNYGLEQFFNFNNPQVKGDITFINKFNMQQIQCYAENILTTHPSIFEFSISNLPTGIYKIGGLPNSERLETQDIGKFFIRIKSANEQLYVPSDSQQALTTWATLSSTTSQYEKEFAFENKNSPLIIQLGVLNNSKVFKNKNEIFEPYIYYIKDFVNENIEN